MIPARVNFTIYQGSDFVYNFAMKQNGTAMSLVGATIALQARETVDSLTTLIKSGEAPLGSGENLTITITDVNQGLFKIAMTAAQTATLDFITAEWDLEITISSVVTRFFEGIMTLSKEVTR